MPHRAPPLAAFFLTLLGMATTNVAAQPLGDRVQPAMPQQTQSLPPAVRVGLRMAALHARIPTAPVLVLVPNGPSLVGAIKHWSLERRFPILIDDGSDTARDHIARFVNAFEPERIIRYTPDDPPADTRDTLETAVARAWGVDTPAALADHWRTLEWQPPGIVLTDPDDPARFAAAALAAGRGQILTVARLPRGDANATITADDLATIKQLTSAAAEASGFSFAQLGDDIEALTILAAIPTKSPAGPPQGNPTDGPSAITDALARDDNNNRWGYAGLINGDAVESTYRVMASLFTQPRSVFLFDGYAKDFAPPYAMDPAANAWRRVGFTVEQIGPPLGSIASWRARTAGSFDHGIVQVNTSGQHNTFDLTPGRASARDIPMLMRPTLVVFIHSFSAQNPASTSNIANQWLRRGAFACIGSVHEPFLGAFPTPELTANRFLAGMPLGSVVRADEAPPWKLNTLGDPLFTLIRAQPRLDEAPDDADLLPTGTAPLTRELNAALTERDLPRALRTLTLLGRLDDAAALAQAALRDQDAAKEGFAMTPAAAAQAWPAARHAVRAEPTLLAEIHTRLPRELAERSLTTDQLWHAATPLLADASSTPPDALIMTLRTAIRDQCAIDDANTLRPHIQRLFDREAVVAMYAQLAERATDARQQAALRRALDGMR